MDKLLAVSEGETIADKVIENLLTAHKRMAETNNTGKNFTKLTKFILSIAKERKEKFIYLSSPENKSGEVRAVVTNKDILEELKKTNQLLINLTDKVCKLNNHIVTEPDKKMPYISPANREEAYEFYRNNKELSELITSCIKRYFE